MATKKNKGGKQDLADLKARLGLGKSLKRKPEPAPEPAPAPAPAPPVPGAAGQPPVPGQPGAPPGMPQAQPGGHVPPGPVVRPAPPVRRPPPPKPKKEDEDWKPPVSDPNAGQDVSIKDHNTLARNAAFVGILGIACLFALGIGFWFGSGQQQRKLFNAQSKDAARILEVVKPKVEIVQGIAEVVLKHRGGVPDEKVLDKLDRYDYAVEPESIASNKLILGQEITSYLLKFAADSRILADIAKTHVTMTNRVDKKELEELLNKGGELAKQNHGILFDSAGYVKALGDKKKKFTPFEGKLVQFDNQEPVERDGERFITVRYPSTGREVEVPLKSLLFVSTSEFIDSSGPNALKRYNRRHKEVFAKLTEMDQYMPILVEKLEALSNRGDAPLLSFSTGE